MKINFDELFGDSKPLNKSNSFKKASHESQASTTNGMQQQFKKSQLLNQMRSKNKYKNLEYQINGSKQLSPPKNYKKSANQTMRILQSSKEQPIIYHWYKETRFDQGPKVNRQVLRIKKSKQKQLSKKQILAMSQRLSQQSQCNKPKCIKFTKQTQLKRIREQCLPLGAPIKNLRTLTETSQFIKNNHSQLHQRLYQQYKSRQFRQMQLKLKYNELYYLKYRRIKPYNDEGQHKYVPFYSRLDELINRKKKKQDFYDNHVISNGQILNFSPDISVGMKTFRYLNRSVSITPKKQKNQIKGRAQMNHLNRLSYSLNGSFDNSLEKSLTKSLGNRSKNSIQIIRKKQQKFLIKILTLFQQDGFFVMRPQKIQYLDEIQFQIFFPLISKMQESEKIPIHKFQTTLRQYFQSLPKNEKFSLRNNERQRQKYIKIQSQKRSSQKSSQNVNSKARRTKNKFNEPKNDYLLKIQNFV